MTSRLISRRTTVLSIAGGGLAFAASRIQSTEGSNVYRELDVMVPMRDSIRLATDIYRPARGGIPVATASPVLLIRTPYDKSRFKEESTDSEILLDTLRTAEIYVSRGYVVVIQDCRGRFKSEGRFVKYVQEGPDGFDTCEWLLKQPWCDGRIGTFGGSYLAHVQSAAAASSAPGLTVMFLDCGGFSNGYRSGIRQGGAYELKQVTWAVNSLGDSPVIAENSVLRELAKKIDVKFWLTKLPWRRGDSPLSIAPDYEDYVFDQWEHGVFDDFWKQPSIYWAGYYENCHAATVHMSGWYDQYVQTAVENYTGLKAIGRKTHLIIGPWTHTASSATHSGDVEFGRSAALAGSLAKTYAELRLRFFDRYLKNILLADEPTVRIFVMGGGSGRRNSRGLLEHGGNWRYEADWPIPRAVETAYFLRRGGRLEIAPGDDGDATFVFDPADPVPTVGGALPGHHPFEKNKGGFDQKTSPDFFPSGSPFGPLSNRPDVLSFCTEPLQNDVEITGNIIANLWISSDCVDTDFTFKLIDVYPPSDDYPNGYALNLTDGILRVRYRESWEAPKFLSPGEIAMIKIEAFPTSNLFKKGHQIRIDISSSNFPRFDVNSNSGEPDGKMFTIKSAKNTVHMNLQRPSHVVLPIIPIENQRKN
jgi:putative CocE/NonD family hydrolase